MKPDGTDPRSTADEHHPAPEGNHVTGPSQATGPEIEVLPPSEATSWSYLFVHHTKVPRFEQQLAKDQRTYFVHKTVRYYRRPDQQRVRQQEVPSISGLIFLQGPAADSQAYLDAHFPHTHLCNDCSTGRVARIPDRQMRPFMRINRIDPDRIRFLLRPFHYYARNRIRLRITSGELAGLEGYVIRIDRDRRIVMDVGGMSVAIAGIHAEHFEEADPRPQSDPSPSGLHERNLHERQAFVDRYFHPVHTPQEAQEQADAIADLRHHLQTTLAQQQLTLSEAWTLLTFLIEEIGYYHTPRSATAEALLAPIHQQGRHILAHLETLLHSSPADSDTRLRFETDLQELLTHHGHLFTEAPSTSPSPPPPLPTTGPDT